MMTTLKRLKIWKIVNTIKMKNTMKHLEHESNKTFGNREHPEIVNNMKIISNQKILRFWKLWELLKLWTSWNNEIYETSKAHWHIWHWQQTLNIIKNPKVLEHMKIVTIQYKLGIPQTQSETREIIESHTCFDRPARRQDCSNFGPSKLSAMFLE